LQVAFGREYALRERRLTAPCDAFREANAVVSSSTCSDSVKALRRSATSRRRCAATRQYATPGPAPSRTILRRSSGMARRARAAHGALGHSPAVRPQGEEPGPQRHEYPQCRVAAWRRWLELENRCVVPSSSFSDNEVLPDGMRSPVWLAFDESRPLAFFAGLWTCWSSVRKVKVRRDANDLCAIHRKAMPVILTTQAEINAWLTAKATQP
jgi:putative SOS response-associated peptidase YedK